MVNDEQRNVKTGFLEGVLDGALMKTLWDDETSDAEKDFPYFIGNLVAGSIQPGAYACVGVDLARGNYKF